MQLNRPLCKSGPGGERICLHRQLEMLLHRQKLLLSCVPGDKLKTVKSPVNDRQVFERVQQIVKVINNNNTNFVNSSNNRTPRTSEQK